MPPSNNRPSKQFIKRGSIAIGIVALILIVQTAWFQKLVFHREKNQVVSQTVGDYVGKDTNGNGVADWEERLWGLDPSVLYTNGVPNAQIIEQKKKSLGVQEANSEPLDDTDRLARELFTLTAALGQSDDIDKQTLADIATKLGNSVDIKEVNNQYSLKDLTVVPTTQASLQTYHDRLKAAFLKYNLNTPDIEILANALDTEDTSQLEQLKQTEVVYRSIAKDIKAIPVPVGLASADLNLVNSFAGIGISMTYMTELDDNSLAALVGLAIYKNYNTKLTTATTAITAYFTQYGIL